MKDMKQLRIKSEQIKGLIEELENQYTITDIASELGVCVSTIYGWTTGRRQPKKIYIEKLKAMVKEITEVDNG